MTRYAWRAATPDGRVVEGEEPAISGEALERVLGLRGLFPIDVAVTTARTDRGLRPRRSRRADVVECVRHLALLLGADFPLDRALGAVARVAARDDVREALADVRERVRAGVRLADAFEAHPAIFPRLAVGMARAGERGGMLAPALRRLAGQLEREHALRARVASAMVYPLVLATAGTASVLVLVLYVLPTFAAMLEDAGATLPRSTRLLLEMAGFAAQWWPLLLALPVGGAFVLARARSDTGRHAVHAMLLRLPVVGSLRRQLAASRVARALGSLLAAGVPIVPALTITAASLPDAAVAAAVLRARDEVRTGSRLVTALAGGGVFPFLFLQMVDVGEEGGRLPEMLDRSAVMEEDELARRLDRLVQLLEPAMILLFGLAVGFVALALLQAIYGFQPQTLGPG